MRRSVAIHQPNFMPWGAFWHKLLNCDHFVFLEDAQYSKGGYINRTQLKDGWLTVPVHVNGSPPISRVEIASDNQPRWTQKHLNRIQQLYQGDSYFDGVFHDLRKAYSFSRTYKYNYLSFFNRKVMMFLCRHIHGTFPICNADYSFGDVGGGTKRLVNICKRLDANVYISGSSGLDYLDIQQFIDAGIHVEIQEIRPSLVPPILDVIMNHSPEVSRKILQGGENWATLRNCTNENSDCRVKRIP